MKVTIEIGTDQEKRQIAQELSLIDEVRTQFAPPLEITHIIVASDFEGRVHEIMGDTHFKATQGIEPKTLRALAKVCPNGDGYIIVVSKDLYIQHYDSQVRHFMLIREVVHVLNKRKFPHLAEEPDGAGLSMSHLYRLYDDYCANRLAYDFCDGLNPTKSPFWKEWTENNLKLFLDILFTPVYYALFRNEIEAYRHHASLETFLTQTQDYFDVVSLVLTHLFARHHHYLGDVAPDVYISKFVTSKTIDLMDFYAYKFEQNSADLSDGLDLIHDFEANFGLKFVPGAQDGHFEVIDI